MSGFEKQIRIGGICLGIDVDKTLWWTLGVRAELFEGAFFIDIFFFRVDVMIYIMRGEENARNE